MKDIEDSIIANSRKLESSFASRCKDECAPSYHSCSNILPNLVCSSEFSLPKCQQDCFQAGRRVNFTSSVVQLANKYSIIDSQNQEIQEMICFSEFLYKDFDEMRKNHSGIKWQYFGSYNGVMRAYPGRDRCGTYDPRTRSWYISSLTGSKNLMLLLDVSNSLESSQSSDLSKKIAIQIINETLEITDFMGFLSFNNTVEAYSEELIEASLINKQNISLKINNTINFGSQTNFTLAFQKTYEILKSNKDKEIGRWLSQTIIVWVTDGGPNEPTSNEENQIKLYEIIKKNKG